MLLWPHGFRRLPGEAAMSRATEVVASRGHWRPLHSYVYVCICIVRSNPGLSKLLWPAGAPILAPPSRLLTPSRFDGSLCSDGLKSMTWLLAALRDGRKLSPSLGRVWPVVLNSRCQQLFVTSAPADSFPGLLCSLATKTHIRHH